MKTNCKFYNISNLEGQDYPTFGLRVSSYLATSPDGRIMRVQFGAIEGKALVEYYDTSYNIQSTVTVPLALPEFGGFYEVETVIIFLQDRAILTRTIQQRSIA